MRKFTSPSTIAVANYVRNSRLRYGRAPKNTETFSIRLSGSLVQHSQMVSTCQPAFRSSRSFFRSRFTFPKRLRFQKAAFVVGTTLP